MPTRMVILPPRSSRFDPAKNILYRHAQGAAFDHDVDASVSDHQTGSHLILRRYKGETNQKKQRGQGRSRKAARSESSKHSITTRTARAEEVADQAGTDFACFISVEPKKNAIAVSRETLPAPKISTIRETIRKMKGAAAINLSGSEKPRQAQAGEIFSHVGKMMQFPPATLGKLPSPIKPHK